MSSVKQEVLSIVSTLPDTIDLDEIIERLNQIKQRQCSIEHTATVEAREDSSPVSFAEAAPKYNACVKDAPPDLSTNPIYMEGYGA